jgi:hypothetical protein
MSLSDFHRRRIVSKANTPIAYANVFAIQKTDARTQEWDSINSAASMPGKSVKKKKCGGIIGRSRYGMSRTKTAETRVRAAVMHNPPMSETAMRRIIEMC